MTAVVTQPSWTLCAQTTLFARTACERIGEFVAIERLDEEAVHSGFEAGVTVIHQGVRGQCENDRP